VSLEVSPVLAYDTASTLAAAKDLHAKARCSNLLIKIPGPGKAFPLSKRRSLHNQLGIAIAKRIYAAARKLLSRIYNLGARPQRLLWASTGTKDPNVSDVYMSKPLPAPFTVNTMPETTLNALAEHSELGSILPPDGGKCEETLARFAEAGIDIEILAAILQDEGAKAFVKSWNDLLECIGSKVFVN
jgi:transaldolase